MLYLSIIYHMHQPYYKDLLTEETDFPWVRLHGIKDYLDMVEILENYPKIKLTFNLVPSLVEQINDYVEGNIKDRYFILSYKPVQELTPEEKRFILDNFFHINLERVISFFPRYYELYLKRQNKIEFSLQDFLDLQVWFNLAWFDPLFREKDPFLNDLIKKARFFTEEEKQYVLDKEKEILEKILPTYKHFKESAQIEIITSPYYHPILPLLYSTKTAKEANPKTELPKKVFSFPQDILGHLRQAKALYNRYFESLPSGLWPPEEAVSEHIVDFLIQEGFRWIITDEAILFKSLRKKKRAPELIYQPHILKRKEGDLVVVFRDRNLSDLISFVYQNLTAQEAVNDFITHLKNIYLVHKEINPLVCVALDGENAWEYYKNDGRDFLNLLYKSIEATDFIKTVTVSEYLNLSPPRLEIERLACGSWIFGNLNKWIGSPFKNRAWDCLTEAREKLEEVKFNLNSEELKLALKQIYILEGSDWFWWYGENHTDFDKLFRQHLINFYNLIKGSPPEYLKTLLS
ncbi:MAG: glycoside hydrolase family 57 protein, partial [Candidatus Omnitrophica bacterium]|nr:glycoside hydrolase family 57 protein [Candidatus Omnitrophota bacterium]